MKTTSFTLLSLLLLSACEPDGPRTKVGLRPPDEVSQNPTVTLSQADFEALLARVGSLETSAAAAQQSLTAIQQRLTAEEAATSAVLTRLEQAESLGPVVGALASTAEEHAARLEANEYALTAVNGRVDPLVQVPQVLSTLLDKTADLSIRTEADGQRTVVFSGVNVQLLNRSHTEDPDGTGNLILGTNKLNGQARARGGSHNLVIGIGASYPGVGSLLVGDNHSAGTGRFNVLFGSGNTINGGNNGSLLGGVGNTLGGGAHNAILGGTQNSITNASRSTVLGGRGHHSGTAETIIPLGSKT